MGRKTQKNNLTNEKLMSSINPENKRLIEDFLMYLRSIQRSEQTIEKYKNNLEIFFVWNLKNNKNKFFVDLTKRDIISFQNYLISENKNSPSRVRVIKSTLSSLSNYIENILDDEFPKFRNIISKVENPVNQPVREKTILTDEQLEEILKYFVEKQEYKKACAIALGAYSGARKSEICIFKIDYFKDENIIYGSLYKTPEKIKTKGRGNGKYIHRYVLSKQFYPYLKLWLEQRDELGIESEWLFPDKDDPTLPMSPNCFHSWCITISNIIKTPFYVHCLRHYFTTFLSRQNIPDEIIKEIIGWESQDMVKVYKDIDTDEAIGKYFNENGIVQVESKKLSDL